jgi:hypothetical protein
MRRGRKMLISLPALTRCLACLAFASLSACGGGGGGNDTSPPATVSPPVAPPPVAPPPVSTVEVGPDQLVLFVGDRRAVTTTVKATDGSTLVGRTVTWTTLNQSIATVDTSGEITAVAVGTTLVRAEVGGQHADVAVTVTPPISTSADYKAHFPYRATQGQFVVASDINIAFSQQHLDHLIKVWQHFSNVFARTPGTHIELYYTRDLAGLYAKIIATCPTTVVPGGRSVTACFDLAKGVYNMFIVPYTEPDFGTQLHEVGHLFLFFTQFDSANWPWFNEGISMYWESGYFAPSGGFEVGAPHPYLVSNYRRASGANTLVTLSVLSELTRDQFYGDSDAARLYSQAGMLLYYLFKEYPAVMQGALFGINTGQIASNSALVDYILQRTALSAVELNSRATEYARQPQFSVTPTVGSPNVSLSAAPTEVNAGGGVSLQWNSNDVSKCTASGAWSGPRAASGTQFVGGLTANVQFKLGCSGVYGPVEAAAEVSVRPQPPLSFLEADPPIVLPGTITTLRWSSQSAEQCAASGDWSGPRPRSGYEPVGPISTTSLYRLACIGPGGTSSTELVVGVEPVAPESDDPVEIYSVEFVEVGGRPMHEGLVSTSSEPVARGSPVQLRVQLVGRAGMPTFEFVDDVGLVVVGTAILAATAGSTVDLPRFAGFGSLPSSAFRLRVSGVDSQGRVYNVLSRRFVPLPFEARLPSGVAPLSVGTALAVPMTIQNHGMAATFQLQVTAMGSLILESEATQILQLNAGESRIVNVNVRVPAAQPYSYGELTATLALAASLDVRNTSKFGIQVTPP